MPHLCSVRAAERLPYVYQTSCLMYHTTKQIMHSTTHSHFPRTSQLLASAIYSRWAPRAAALLLLTSNTLKHAALLKDPWNRFILYPHYNYMLLHRYSPHWSTINHFPLFPQSSDLPSAALESCSSTKFLQSLQDLTSYLGQYLLPTELTLQWSSPGAPNSLHLLMRMIRPLPSISWNASSIIHYGFVQFLYFLFPVSVVNIPSYFAIFMVFFFLYVRNRENNYASLFQYFSDNYESSQPQTKFH